MYLPSSLQVREDVDLRIFTAFIQIARRAALDLAELLGKPLQRAEIEMLVGKAQHAITAEPQQDPPKIITAQGLRQIHPRTVAPNTAPVGSIVSIAFLLVGAASDKFRRK